MSFEIWNTFHQRDSVEIDGNTSAYRWNDKKKNEKVREDKMLQWTELQH